MLAYTTCDYFVLAQFILLGCIYIVDIYIYKDINGCETSKEDFGNQILLQRHETNEASIKSKMKIDLGNKVKVMSKERQKESTKLNKSRMSSENIVEKKERKISSLEVKRKELEISKKVLNKQIIQKCDENTELSETLKTESDSGNEIQTLSKANQDERTSLNKISKLICSNQTTSCLKEDIEYITTSKEGFEKQVIQREMRPIT